MRSLVTYIFLCACESWTLTAELQRRIQAMEMRCYCKDTTHPIQKTCYQRGSPCKDPAGNRTTRRSPDHHKETQTAVYGHVSCSSDLAKTILQGTVKRGRRHGRQKKGWEDNIREWTGLELAKSQRAVENRGKWRNLVTKISVVPQQPSRSRAR